VEGNSFGLICGTTMAFGGVEKCNKKPQKGLPTSEPRRKPTTSLLRSRFATHPTAKFGAAILEMMRCTMQFTNCSREEMYWKTLPSPAGCDSKRANSIPTYEYMMVKNASTYHILLKLTNFSWLTIPSSVPRRYMETHLQNKKQHSDRHTTTYK
jgi:hypothetical protein